MKIGVIQINRRSCVSAEGTQIKKSFMIQSVMKQKRKYTID